MVHIWVKIDVHTRFGGENWGKEHLKDLCIDGRILLIFE